MSTKYEMGGLAAKLGDIVESEWPLTLEELEDYDRSRENLEKESYCVCDEWPDRLLPEPIAAIALAEEFNIRSILPAAYYDLWRSGCSLNSNWDWDDAIKEGVFLLSGSEKPLRLHYLPKGAFDKLWHLQAAINGICFHILECGPRMSTAPMILASACANATVCDISWRNVHTQIHRALLSHRDILRGFRELYDESNPEERRSSYKMCPKCGQTLDKAVAAAKEGLWKELEKCCGSDPEV